MIDSRKSFLFFLIIVFCLSFSVYSDDAKKVFQERLKELDNDIEVQKLKLKPLQNRLSDIKKEKEKILIYLKELSLKENLILELRESLKTASAKEKQLISDIQKAKEQLNLKHKDIARFKQDIKALKDDISSKYEDISRFKKDIETRDKYLEDNLLTMNKKDKLVAELKENLRIASEKEKKLSQELEKSEGHSVYLNSELTQSREKISSFKKDIAVKDKEIKKIKWSINEKEDCIIKLKDEAAAFSKKEKGLTLVVKDIEKKLDSKSKEFNQVSDYVGYMKKDVYDKKAVIQKLEEDSARLKKELAGKDKDIIRLNKEIDSFTSKIYSQDKKYAKLEAKLELAGKESESVKNLRQQLKRLEKENKQLSLRLDEAKAEIVSASVEPKPTAAGKVVYRIPPGKKKELVSLKKKLSSAEKTIKDNLNSLDKSEKLMLELQESLASVNAQNKDLSAGLKRANKQIASLNKKLEVESKAGKTSFLPVGKQLRIENLTDKIKRQNSEIRSLRQLLAEHSGFKDSKIQGLAAESKEKDEEIKYLKSVITEALEKIKSLSIP